jgi:L1 cell adhesion molecule like protein
MATLGLDVGNTCCTMAVMRQGALHVIANEQGSRSTPSCVAFSEGETLVGEAALGQVARNPRHTVVDLLVMLGRAFDDPVVQAALSRWRFAACAAEKDGTVAVEAPAGKAVGAVRLLSLLVTELRTAADAYIGSPVKEVVLAVPPFFSPARADALVEAARAGGMRVKSALPSPLAVALLFLSEHELPSSGARRVLVVDVGGSSTSVCVVDCDADADDKAPPVSEGSEATPGARARSQLRRLSLASCVSEDIGGNLIDEKMVAHALRDVKRRSRVDLVDNARALSRLRAACESGKRSLSGSAQTQIAVEADGVDYFVSLNRANLDELAKPVCHTVRRLVLLALGAAGSAPPVGDGHGACPTQSLPPVSSCLPHAARRPGLHQACFTQPPPPPVKIVRAHSAPPPRY